MIWGAQPAQDEVTGCGGRRAQPAEPRLNARCQKGFTAGCYYRSLGGLSILYFRTITYTCMHACARALHDAVKASTPVERNFLQLGPGPFLGWGRRFCPWYCYRKTKKTKQKKTKKKYCTVEIPTEMEFTGTFQKYLQCVNRM